MVVGVSGCRDVWGGGGGGGGGGGERRVEFSKNMLSKVLQ